MPSSRRGEYEFLIASENDRIPPKAIRNSAAITGIELTFLAN